MQQLKTFFYSLFNSLTNPSYYSDVLKSKAWFSWKYFLFWNVAVSFVVLLYVVPTLVQFEPERVSSEVVSVYPQDLEIYVGADGIDINQERPYSIAFPEKWLEGVSEEEQAELEINNVPVDSVEDLRLLTFELDENIQNIQDFYASDSFVVLTESTIYMLDDTNTGEVRVYAMPSFENEFSFSYANLQDLEQKILNHPFVAQKWYVVMISLFIVVIMIPLTIWWRVLTIAVYSLFVWIAAGFFIKSLKLSYGKAFQVGLHTLTLPVLIKILAGAVNVYSSIQIEFGGLLFFVVYMIWTLFVLKRVADDTPRSKVSTKTVAKKTIKKNRAKASSANAAKKRLKK